MTKSLASWKVLFRPLFSLEAAVSVFGSMSSTSMSLNNSLKTVPQISKFGISSPNGSFLCNFQHFSVSVNSFYGNKDYKLAGNFKLPATKLFREKLVLPWIRFAGRKNFATPPNTEYIFCQLAVNIMWYCRLKIAICLYYSLLDWKLVKFPQYWCDMFLPLGSCN